MENTNNIINLADLFDKFTNDLIDNGYVETEFESKSCEKNIQQNDDGTFKNITCFYVGGNKRLTKDVAQYWCPAGFNVDKVDDYVDEDTFKVLKRVIISRMEVDSNTLSADDMSVKTAEEMWPDMKRLDVPDGIVDDDEFKIDDDSEDESDAPELNIGNAKEIIEYIKDTAIKCLKKNFVFEELTLDLIHKAINGLERKYCGLYPIRITYIPNNKGMLKLLFTVFFSPVGRTEFDLAMYPIVTKPRFWFSSDYYSTGDIV